MPTNYDAIRPETAPPYDPTNPEHLEKGPDWSECETCGMIVHIAELEHDSLAPLEFAFSHKGHIA